MTVRLAAADAVLAPAGPVESAPAAIDTGKVPPMEACTGMLMAQLPRAGMIALASDTEALETCSAAPVPKQVIAGAGMAGIVRPAGSERLKADWVKSNPLVLPILMVSVEVAFAAIIAGDQLGIAVGAAGAAGFAPSGAGQAEDELPDDVGAVLVSVEADSVTVSISALPAESVTVSVSVPVPPGGMLPGAIVTCALPAPLAISVAGFAVHAKEAMLLPHEATLVLASSTAAAPNGNAGVTMTPIGFSAALTAPSALTMPVPHCSVTPGPGGGQEHSPLVGSVAGHTASGGTALLAGKALALDLRRATSWAGVRFAFTDRIRAAMPETIGAEKLVPRLGFCSLV